MISWLSQRIACLACDLVDSNNWKLYMCAVSADIDRIFLKDALITLVDTCACVYAQVC